jgi:hypothetical protein
VIRDADDRASTGSSSLLSVEFGNVADSGGF